MDEVGRGEAEIGVEQDVLRRRRHPLLTADDVADLHLGIVDDIGEVIGRHPVRLDEHLHVDARPRHRHRAIDAVGEVAAAVARDFHAQHMRLAFGDATLGLGGGEGEAVAVVLRRDVRLALRRAHAFEPLGRTEAAKGIAVGQQLVGIAGIDALALALAIGRVRAALVGAFIPFESHPAERIHDLGFAVGGRAALIGILDPQDELAAVAARERFVDQRGIERADMRLARWGGRDTNADGTGHARDFRVKCGSGARLAQMGGIWPPRSGSASVDQIAR